MSHQKQIPKSVDVSVVIPCFNCKDTIERAVVSVYEQNARPFELLLVDDKSTDDTLDKLKSLQKSFPDQWIKIIALTKNGGPSSARNAGWDAAVGKYVALLDSDDIWHPQKLELQLSWMEAHPDVDLSGHELLIFNPKERKTDFFNALEYESSCLDSLVPIRFSKLRLLLSGNLSTSSVMVKRSIPNRFMPGKFQGEDRLLLLEMACSGRLIYKLPLVLEGKFKELVGAGGLSGSVWLMEKGELDAFYRLWKSQHIGTVTYCFASVFSLAKYIRRLIVIKLRNYRQ